MNDVESAISKNSQVIDGVPAIPKNSQVIDGVLAISKNSQAIDGEPVISKNTQGTEGQRLPKELVAMEKVLQPLIPVLERDVVGLV